MFLIDPPEAFITDAEIDHAEAIHEEAGCPRPSDCTDILNTCVGCGKYVCPDHSPDAVECVEVGDHHATCQSDCDDCAASYARDWADERARALTGRW